MKHSINFLIVMYHFTQVYKSQNEMNNHYITLLTIVDDYINIITNDVNRKVSEENQIIEITDDFVKDFVIKSQSYECDRVIKNRKDTEEREEENVNRSRK